MHDANMLSDSDKKESFVVLVISRFFFVFFLGGGLDLCSDFFSSWSLHTFYF